jgi:hypothetical protein
VPGCIVKVLAGSSVPPGKCRQGHRRTICEHVFDRKRDATALRTRREAWSYFCGSGGALTSIPRASSAPGDQPASSP